MASLINDPSELARRLGVPKTAGHHLTEALTHRTYAVEKSIGYDNQRLEFLGDAVLEIIQTDYLFRRYPDAPEGELTKMRAELACEATLAAFSRRLGLGGFLRIGRGESENGGADRESTLADLFEAVLGAIYLDCGLDSATKFVTAQMEAENIEPRRRLSTSNPKGKLQELSQQRWGITPIYTVLRVTGPQHAPNYDVEVKLNSYTAIGSGHSRKLAESDAAGALYHYLSFKEQ